MTLDSPFQDSGDPHPEDDLDIYRSLVDSLPLNIYRIDLQGRLTFVNRTLLEQLGCPLEEVIGKCAYDFYPAELARKYRNDDAQVVASDEMLQLVEENRNPATGQTLYVEVIKIPVHDRSGSVVGIQGVFWDITERVNADARLRESEQLLRTVMDEIPSIIILKDHKGDFLLANQALARLYNTSPEAMVGKNDRHFGVAPEMADFFRDNVLQIMARGETEIVYEDSRDAITGEIRHFKSIKKPFRNAHGENQILVIATDITDIIRAQEKISESEQRLQQVMVATREGIWDWHLPSGRLIHNPQWYEILGYGEHEIGDSFDAFASLIDPQDRALVRQRLDDLIDGRSEAYYSEHRMLRRDGRPIWVQDRGRIVERDEQGRPARVIGSFSDISDRKRAEEKLQLAASVFSAAREGIIITDDRAVILDVNQAFTHITGYSKSEALGRRPGFLSSGQQSRAYYQSMWRELLGNGHWQGEIWNRRKSGEVYAELLTISAVRDEHGKTSNYVGLFTDITPLKQHESQLEHIAHYDALTGLPNRVLLGDRLYLAMIQAQRRDQQVAVAYLDLDGFKEVNDRHGHEVGDRLLSQLAIRMKQTLREGDTIARLGGDEFVAVFMDLEDSAAAIPLLGRLLGACAQPALIGDVRLQVSASIGVTHYPQSEEVDADQLLRQADQAMYQAKLAGKNRYHIFDPEYDRTLRGHHESLEGIQQALQERQFLLHYQPKVNMRSGEVIGVEALIRWQHPQKGLLAPGLFLPVIEEHPLMAALGEWVIDQALCQQQIWVEQGLDIPVSVNIGAYQLQQHDFIARLQLLLEAHPGFQADNLQLEVLETSALQDMTHVARVTQACRSLGIGIALDDFGTGYSSLTYLKRLPADVLKIDQSFVRDMLEDPDDLAILEGVLGLATAFRRQAIAEGVETVEHGEMLLQLGCELAQGYAIARPMAAHELPDWIGHWRPHNSWLNIQPIGRNALPLLFAKVDHRAWMHAIEECLKGTRLQPPPLNPQQCRFGSWFLTEGAHRFSSIPGYQGLDQTHRRLHQLADDLLDRQVTCDADTRQQRHAELRQVSGILLAQLQQLIDSIG